MRKLIHTGGVCGQALLTAGIVVVAAFVPLTGAAVAVLADRRHRTGRPA
jgi:hypothetical protein